MIPGFWGDIGAMTRLVRNSFSVFFWGRRGVKLVRNIFSKVLGGSTGG